MLLILLLLISLSFGEIAPKYRLLKQFYESGDEDTALFLLRNYPNAVFEDELRVDLAYLYLEKGSKLKAFKIVKWADLSNVREEFKNKVRALWFSLDLDPDPLVLRFPEIAEEKLFQTEASKEERVLRRLLRKRKYREVLKLSQNCYFKGLALRGLKKYKEALEVLRDCKDERAYPYVISLLFRLKKVKEAESFAKRVDKDNLYLLLGRMFLTRKKFEKARRYFLYTKVAEGRFLAGVVDYILGRYLIAYEEFSQAQAKTTDPKELAKIHFWKYKTLRKLGIKELALHYLELSSQGNGPYAVFAKKIIRGRVYKPPRRVKPLFSSLVEELKEVKDLGFLHYMRLEAYRIYNRFNPREVVALQRVDPHLSIKLAVRLFGTDSEVYKNVAFPTPFGDIVYRLSRKFAVPRSLIYAVMRQESLFDPLALSRSDAKGLMQLIDTTAKWQAERLRIKINNIFDPKENLTLGVAYLSHLINFWNGDLVRAIASYNAGPGAVRRWLDFKDPILFIETIPYRETRKYTKRVLMFFYIYRELLSEPAPDPLLKG